MQAVKEPRALEIKKGEHPGEYFVVDQDDDKIVVTITYHETHKREPDFGDTDMLRVWVEGEVYKLKK